jgi:hypothetical protein
MRSVNSAVALVLVWAIVAGVLSAYIRWCFRFSPDRHRMWREVLRRAGSVPLLFLAIIVSQWLVNRVDTPADRKSLLLGFIIAWLVPPVITLVKQVMAAPGAISVNVTGPPLTAARPTSSASALTALVASAIIALGAWSILAIAGAPDGWVGSMAVLPPLALLVTLFLLTRRAERSIADHAARTRRVGMLWSIGMALLAFQIAVVAEAMGRLTLIMAIGVTGTFLVSVVFLAVLVRPGRSRR